MGDLLPCRARMTMVWACVDEVGLEVATVWTYQTCERPLVRPAAVFATGVGSDVRHSLPPVASRIATLIGVCPQGITGVERRVQSWIKPLLGTDQTMVKNELTANHAAKPAASGAPPRGRPV